MGSGLAFCLEADETGLMARPLRIEFAGAVYHVTSRGDRREPIFADDDDRAAMLAVVGKAMERFESRALAWCLMGNHYHFVLQTAHPNLSALMRQVNGVYTQRYNARHDKVGHLFQGRYTALLVDRQNYLLEACRYVELNPVRAGFVAEPGTWRWSSYAANAGSAQPLPWLDTAGLWAHLTGHPPASAAEAAAAATRYRAWVAAGLGKRLWDDALRQQIYLGDEAFVERMRQRADAGAASSVEIPRTQRAAPLTLTQWLAQCPTRDEAIARAHRESQISMTQIARELGLSVSRVSRILG
jgi:REP element-mobilizing transposase RayT